MDGGHVIGQQIGNYRVVSLLGEGGMGAVYLAEHPTIGRRVAVKLLRPELARDTGAVTRFLNEARAANAIRHRNIIEMFDAGDDVRSGQHVHGRRRVQCARAVRRRAEPERDGVHRQQRGRRSQRQRTLHPRVAARRRPARRGP